MERAEQSGGLHKRSAEAWGNSLRARGAELLSVLRTWVTKQPRTCVTAKWDPHDSSALALRTMMRYALERESCRGSTFAIPIELPKRRNVGLRTLPGVRSVTTHRLSVDQSIQEIGPEGLLNLSSKPHSCSHETPEAIENAILALRGKYPSWGARKLKARLEQLDPSVEWPVASTFGNILQRACTSPKRKKRRTTPYSEPFSEVTAPNQLWCMDFRGTSPRVMVRVAIRSRSPTPTVVI